MLELVDWSELLIECHVVVPFFRWTNRPPRNHSLSRVHCPDERVHADSLPKSRASIFASPGSVSVEALSRTNERLEIAIRLHYARPRR